MNRLKNHARLAAMKDRKTADIFAAQPGGEDLTLAGETVSEVETFAQRCERIERERSQAQVQTNLF